MNSAVAVCPGCQNSLPGAYCNTPAPVACPACDATFLLAVFPAFFKPATPGAAAETIVEEGVSSCFYHEQKKAVVPCHGCGRFLCALCDLELDGRHYCPTCLQAGRKKGKPAQLENKRTLHDGAALTLVLVPLLFWPVVLVTAPLAVYLAILSWSRPGSVVPRTRWRSWLALVLGPVEFLGCAGFLYYLFTRH